MKIKKNLVLRAVGPAFLLIPVGETVLQNNGLFHLSEVGAFLWQHIPDVQTEEELVELVCNAYEIDAETAAADVHEFLLELEKMEILDISE